MRNLKSRVSGDEMSRKVTWHQPHMQPHMQPHIQPHMQPHMQPHIQPHMQPHMQHCEHFPSET
ncbi:hypothetical protein BgiMline_022960, partial [Biomphalaria glabrata]